MAVAIFVVALVVIASERVDRTKVALLGAMLIVLTQTIDQEHAIEAVDWNTPWQGGCSPSGSSLNV